MPALDGIILTVKKFLKTIVWKTLDIYEQNFSSSSMRATSFDKFVGEHKIFFTTDIDTNGFTDQLIRLLFFHKVGTRLGLHYHFTPLQSTRTNKSFDSEDSNSFQDIYDFTGVHSHLRKLSNPLPSQDLEPLVINLDDIDFERRAKTSLRNFIFYLKLKIEDKIGNRIDVIIHFQGSQNVFHHFRLTSPVETPLTLRDWYDKNREKRPWDSVFDRNKMNLLMHIRQGDSAIIETPWNSFIGTGYKLENRFVEFPTKEAVGDHWVIDVDFYHKFLKELFWEVNKNQFSTALFSDGFKRSFQTIYEHKDMFDFNQSQINKLKNSEEKYDDIQFKDFEEWDEVKTFIGESKEKLFNLVHSFIESDIIIFGTQEKFIPKMVALYSDPENMPMMIHFYQKKHPHVGYLGISHSSERILFVDIHNYDIREISNRIIKFMESKNRVKNPN